MKELELRMCKNCGAVVKVIDKCTCENCGITCCGEEMMVLPLNSVDAIMEKHLPTYKTVGEEIIVKIDHVMDKEHYIKWICLISDNEEVTYYFKPNDKLEVSFKYVKGASLYAFCNRHGLWKINIK